MSLQHKLHMGTRTAHGTENRQLTSCSRSDNLGTRLLGGIFENIINNKKKYYGLDKGH